MMRASLTRTPLYLALALAVGVQTLSAGCRRPPLPTSDDEKRQVMNAMADDYAARFPDVPCISAEMLKPLLRPSGEVVLLDTRAPEEYKVSRIPDAVPLREFERNIEAYRGKKIVAYCTIGYRSGRYAAKLRKEGFDVHNLRGGILAWVHADGALENESGATKRVHVYGRDWDLAPEDYETEW